VSRKGENLGSDWRELPGEQRVPRMPGETALPHTKGVYGTKKKEKRKPKNALHPTKDQQWGGHLQRERKKTERHGRC